MTAPYAAPESWRAERATSATDVYALGVMAFEMLTGARPFLGPNFEDYREQHLHSDAPALKSGTSVLRALVGEMLFKAAGARPSAANMLARLEGSKQQQISGGLAKLGEVQANVLFRIHASVSPRACNRECLSRDDAVGSSAVQPLNS